MLACILYFLVLSAPCALAAACGRRYEDALPLSIFASLLLLYAAGLISFLAYGVLAALLLSAVCFAITIVRICTKRIPCKAFLQHLCTPTAAAFALLFAVSVFCNIGRTPYHGDEFSHWAYTVKAMSYCNDFGTASEAASLYASYPPGMSLLQYLLQRLHSFTGGATYTEWLLFPPYQSTAFALLLCLAGRGRTWKNALSLLPLLAAIVLLPTLLYPLFYESVFVDPIIGIMAGYLLSFAWRAESHDALSVCTVCCGLAALTLLKDVGVFFAIVCAAVLFFDFHSAAPTLRAPARTGVLLAVAAAKGSWLLHVTLRDVPVRFSEAAPLTSLPGIITGADTGFRRTALLHYLRAPFEKRIPLGTDTCTMLGKQIAGWQFSVSFLLLAIVLLVLLYVIAAGDDRHNTVSCVRRRRVTGIAALSLLLYWIGLCRLYVLQFVEFEAVELYCYERYLSVPCLMLITLLFAAFVAANTGKLRLLFATLITVFLLAVAPLHCVYPYLTRRSARGSREMTAPQHAIAAFVEKTVPADSRLFLLAQGSDGEGLAQRYLLFPRIVTGGAIEPPLYAGDPWSKDVTCEEWQKILRTGYDYVLLSHVDERFIESCRDAFREPDTIEDGELYAVDRGTGMLTHIAVQ